MPKPTTTTADVTVRAKGDNRKIPNSISDRGSKKANLRGISRYRSRRSSRG